MVELVQGHVLEERRGGTGILSTLVNEMAALGSSGFIRCERTYNDKQPSVGQLLIENGAMVGAIYEQKAILEGLEALLEIESDCMELDSKIQMIEGVDIGKIIDLYPNSILDVELPENSNQDKWWSNIKVRSSSWSRTSRLPEYKSSVGAPEFIQRKAASMRSRLGDNAIIMKPGSMLLFDTNDSTPIYQLAANLHLHGRPLLVLSRRNREEIVVKHDIPANRCLWLSQSEEEGVQFVDPDAIKGTINGFIEGNLRAVLLLDGIDYLGSHFGSKTLISLLRYLVDLFSMNDHVILATTDLSAFEKSDSLLIRREFICVSEDQLEHLSNDSEGLLEHPLLAPPTEEEMMMLEAHLEATRPPIIVERQEIIEADEIVIEDIDIEEMIEDEEIIEDSEIIVNVEPEIIETVETIVKKGPRLPQRIKRKRPAFSANLTNNDLQIRSLNAASKIEKHGKMKEEMLMQLTAIGKGKEGNFPDIPSLIPNSLDQVSRQISAKKTHQLPKTTLGPKPLESAARNMKSLDSKQEGNND